MGLFEKIFPKTKTKVKQTQGEYKMLNGYSPVFTSPDGRIYESELVRAAINAKATHISKLKVEFYGHGAQTVANRLKRPNSFQVWPQFLYQLSTILEIDNTAFIVPNFDVYGRITEIYPVRPASSKLVEIDGEPWVAFVLRNGHAVQMPVWQVGMLTKFQYSKDLFGENNMALAPTMELLHIQNQGIQEGIRSAATYRFMAQYNNIAFGDDLNKEQKRFNSLAANEGGITLLFPKTYDNIKQIDSKPYVVDAEQVKIIKSNVFDYFGVNEDILQGKAYGDSWTAFYESSVESFAIQFSEVMTALMILCGNLAGEAGVMATANRLQYMSNAEKLNVSSQLADRGILNRDEVREIWNLPPIPNGEGQAYVIRGEYKNAADQVNDQSADNGSRTQKGDDGNAGET